MGLYRCGGGENGEKDWTDTYGAVVVNGGVNERQMGTCASASTYIEDAQNFNKPIIVGNNVTSCEYMLSNCRNFNSDITIEGNNLLSARAMLYNCKNFNKQLNLPDSVIECSLLFYQCDNFNSTFNIPNQANISSLFSGCHKFNKPINLANASSASFSSVFYNCTNFNQPVVLQNSVSYTTMFENCVNFNQPVVIPNNGKDCYRMLTNCRNLNSDITIGVNVNRCQSMFNNCVNFNANIIVLNPYNLEDCSYMMAYCDNFNKPLNVGGNVYSLMQRYSVQNGSLVKFNSPLRVYNPTNAYYLMSNLSNFKSTVQFIGNTKNVNMCNSFYRCSNMSAFSIDQNMTLYNTNYAFGFCNAQSSFKVGIHNLYFPSLPTDAEVFNAFNNAINNMFSSLNDGAYMFSYCANLGFFAECNIPNGGKTCTVENLFFSVPNARTIEGMFSGVTRYNNYASICVDVPSSSTQIFYLFYNTSSFEKGLIYNYDDVSKVAGTFYVGGYPTWDVVQNNSSSRCELKRNNLYKVNWYRYW